MFRFALKGAIEYVESTELSALDFVTHAFCTRRGGVSKGPYSTLNLGFLSGDRPEDVRRNKALVEEAFEIRNGRLILMRQVHGERIRVLDSEDPLPEEFPECDGLVSDRPRMALGVRTADCIPLFFVDRVRQVIGAAHAGWRGTALGIAARMVEILVQRFSSRTENLLAVMGPAIGPCCYQVDAPVFDAFSGLFGVDRFLHPCREKGRWMADLALANRLQLQAAGVPSGNIFTSDLCTMCYRDIFFSHRAGGGCEGRQINLLMLKNGNDLKNEQKMLDRKK